MRTESVRLLRTLEHPCGYFNGRMAQNLVIDPLASELPRLYDFALVRGFRRAGGHVYRPDCRRCRACVATRIPVAEFRPDRSMRRCRARNADLSVSLEPVSDAPDVVALYQRYLGWRHPGGGMDMDGIEDFREFVACGWSPTRFLCVRRGAELLAVAVTDVGPHGYSAVYTFYQPDAVQRGLGTFAILEQVEAARRAGAPYLYLGYWIEDHPKMAYKTRFRPIELLRDGEWRRLAPPLA
jgi:arginine-tRNA-protein transferase